MTNAEESGRYPSAEMVFTMVKTVDEMRTLGFENNEIIDFLESIIWDLKEASKRDADPNIQAGNNRGE